MVGGGALFFSLRLATNSFLCDKNSELINLYTCVKDSPEKLHEAVFSLPKSLGAESDQLLEKDFYYEVRDMDRSPDFKKLPKLVRAARFLYLNKLCFNGLYRVNSKNQFNVPFGNYKSPKICSKEQLLNCSQKLTNVELSECDFEDAAKRCKPGDLIYFDPPYVPLSATSSFVSYTKDNFDLSDHKRLFSLLKELKERGVFALMSNSHTQFALAEAKGLKIEFLEARRAIASSSSSRGSVKELLIKNY